MGGTILGVHYIAENLSIWSHIFQHTDPQKIFDNYVQPDRGVLNETEIREDLLAAKSKSSKAVLQISFR